MNHKHFCPILLPIELNLYANHLMQVKKQPEFKKGRRLLDLMDLAVFDFLTGNRDRHSYATFS